MKLKAAIFKNYGGSWWSLANELDMLAQVSGASQEDISLYMQGLNESLPIDSRIKLCEFLGLDPNDFPDLRYRYKNIQITGQHIN